LASDINNKKPAIAKADSGRIILKFVAGLRGTEAGDPFYQWLRDDRSVKIDWNTFGNEKLSSESPR
jgi:hypothetical protein